MSSPHWSSRPDWKGRRKLPPFLSCTDKMAEQGCSKETVVEDDELDDLLESGSLAKAPHYFKW